MDKALAVLTFLVMMTLKVTGYFPYSWWLVTVPLWGPLALVAVIFTAAYVFAWLTR